MMAPDPRAAYLKAGVDTATPERLLVMLVDRLELDVKRALGAQSLGQHDVARRELMHAQDIVIELSTSLKVDSFAGGPQLVKIYDWLLQQLVKANTTRDLRITKHCLELASQLAQTWRDAAGVPTAASA